MLHSTTPPTTPPPTTTPTPPPTTPTTTTTTTGCAYLDISPNYSSSFNALGNTIGALAGLSSPLVVAALVSGY
jgi:hypothetical protein